MAPFRFRLEQVLSYRKRLEEEAIYALTKATQERDGIVVRIQNLEEDRANQRKVLSRPEALDPAERWLIQSYMDALENELADARMTLTILEEEVDKCRAEAVQKSQERSLLDRLKEKQAARHAEEERQKEQRTFDETATLRYRTTAI